MMTGHEHEWTFWKEAYEVPERNRRKYAAQIKKEQSERKARKDALEARYQEEMAAYQKEVDEYNRNLEIPWWKWWKSKMLSYPHKPVRMIDIPPFYTESYKFNVSFFYYCCECGAWKKAEAKEKQ